MRLGAVAVVFLLAAPLAFAQQNEPESTAAGCETFVMPGVGTVCERGPGQYELFSSRTGESLGFTHGADPLCTDCEEPVVAAAADSAPRCVVGGSSEYNVVVIYARASNDADRYATMVGTIRNLAATANAMVDDAAIATGDRLSIRVKCTSGVVDVANAVLPTPMASASFETIVQDLKAQGFNNNRKKYWVYYDDGGACACAGTGHIYFDDSDSVDNLNNGRSNAVPMFAVSFNSASVRTMLHELGHNLGAVQNSAPQSTGAGHCIDGRDTMCYNDGGPRGALYSTGSCSAEVFDCGKNDYCHASPAAGSYLDTHWQACHRQSRFLQFADNVAPVMEALGCAPDPAVADESVTCSFRASDGDVGLYYRVDWGDGTTSRVPATGTVAPGTTQSATHTYAAEGARTVRVNATDSGTPVLTSPDMAYALDVLPPNPAPTISSLACSPASPNEDEPVTCSFSAIDNGDVFYTLSWGDASPPQRMPSSGVVAPETTQSATHAYADPGSYTFTVTATDTAGKPSAPASLALSVADVNTAPVMTSLTCPTTLVGAGATFSCSFVASDDSTGLRYQIDWGDGTTTTKPSSGTLAPGVTTSASHAYAQDGDRVVSVIAIDDGEPSRTSAPATATVRVRADVEGPAVSVLDPQPGVVYLGGCETTLATPAPSTVFVSRGCVRVTATDVSGVDRVEVWRGGQRVAVDTLAPYELTFAVGAAERDAQFLIRAFDTLGLVRNAVFTATGVAGA